MSARLSFLYRKSPSISSSNIFVKRNLGHYATTPIFYVNSSPHIGHVYTLILADAINRYEQLKIKSTDTIFSAGTDEHGLKVQQAAQESKQSIQQHCDINSNKFRNLLECHQLTVTDFIRTTDPKHKRTVQSVWEKLVQSGLIYKANYSGWYCTSDETFVPESQVTTEDHIDGRTRHVNQDGKIVLWTDEENYMFKFSLFHDQVLHWLRNNKPIKPDKFNDLAVSMMKKLNFGDMSISRPKERVNWGIEVPNDPSHTIYVWLDALTNYLTVVGYPCSASELGRWPIDCQIFGKDILKFHAIIWPAILLALNLPLPKKLICHSHWLVGTQKMSKSLGNSIDPFEEANHLTTEGLRYYLLRAGTPHSDTNYNREQAILRLNSELANTYGNLLARACSKKINPSQTVPLNLSDKPDMLEILELKQRLEECSNVCSDYFDEGDFYKGIDEILTILRSANQIYQMAQPWTLVNHADAKYHDVQAITFETLRISSILMQPIVPKLSSLVLARLNVDQRAWTDARYRLNSMDKAQDSLRTDTGITGPVFPRID